MDIDGRRQKTCASRRKNKKKNPVDLDRSGGRDRTMYQRTEIFLLGVTNEQTTGRHKGIGLQRKKRKSTLVAYE